MEDLPTLDQWLADLRQLCQDEHVIADHVVPHLARYIAQQRRAAAQDMRDRCSVVLAQAFHKADLDVHRYQMLLSRIEALPLEAKGKDDARLE